MLITTIFNPGAAEAFAAKFEGVVEFHFDPLPVPGDFVTIRMSPGPVPVKLRCTARHFDHSEREPQVVLYFDLASPPVGVL